MPTAFDPRLHLTQCLAEAIRQVAPDTDPASIVLERPKHAAHGDFATSIALQLARALKQAPRAIAQQLNAALPASAWIAKTEIAGAGFINFYLHPAAKTAVVATILADGARYGQQARNARRIQVEFVSANPTGPLHVGHGRGAAFGASLAALLEFAGYDVSREYYLNDAGRQMDILTVSTWLRYLALHDIDLPFPGNAYQGDYVRNMARQWATEAGAAHCHTAEAICVDVPPWPAPLPDHADVDARTAHTQAREAHLDGLIRAGKTLLGPAWDALHAFVLHEQLADCRDDLTAFGVEFDVWFSEQSLYDRGNVAQTVAALEERGHIDIRNGAKWFRATAFGDEKDRVVQRENGLYTYFASDIAYHVEKFARGFDHVIDIWGADHHGYIPRVRGALRALGVDDARLEIALVQFVNLFRDGVKVGMSTRAGEYVTLRQLRAEAGNDACRFFYLLRKSDQALDFDLSLATAQTNDNPVYYVQYAYARIASVLRQWGGDQAALSTANLNLINSDVALALCTTLARFPELIRSAAQERAPHAVAFYLRDLAADFHAWYNHERLLIEDDALRLARLALAHATAIVIKNGLTLLGVSAPETM